MQSTQIGGRQAAHLNVLHAALAYCDNMPGRLLPVVPNGKRPMLPNWPAAASNDPSQIEKWFDGTGCNLGFTPNRGCFVLDLDRKGDKDGFAQIAKLEAEFGALPPTLTAVTPGGGEHRYFRGPDLAYRTQADSCGYPGVDFRCSARPDGTGAGQVVLPPSQRPEGTYQWKNWSDLNESPEIAEAPTWLVDLACGLDPRKKTKATTRSKDSDNDDPDLLENLADALQYIDSDDYDLWVGVGLALKTLADDAGLDLWLNWSARSKKFDESDARKRWDGFKPQNTHWRVIFTMAQSAGWINPGRPNRGGKEAEAIAEFNKTHAVINAGGSVCILREGASEFGGSSVNFMAKQAFMTYYENRALFIEKESPDGSVQVRRVPLTKAWLTHPDRRTLEGVTFAPSGEIPEGFYNLWRGFTVEPLPLGIAQSARACKRFLHHLKYNICHGERWLFRYLLAWMADMVQDPARKKGVALVLRGKKGTGKSKVADILRHILGGHSFKASKSEHIVGRFSAHLADKLLLVAEESFFAGSKADIGTLKDLITSDTVTIEQKHVTAFEMRSCHRVLMITNLEWAIPATEDERRFFVLDVGEDHMQDHDYFAAIDAEMIDGDGAAAFLTLLQKLDLSKTNLRKVPQTSALATQKRLSLEVHDQFILDCLSDGEICGQAWKEGEDGPLRQEVFDSYVAYARSLNVRPLPSNRFSPHFEKRTGAWAYQPGAGERRRRYHMPSLEAGMARFTQQLGLSNCP